MTYCTRCDGRQRLTAHSEPCTRCGGTGYEPAAPMCTNHPDRVSRINLDGDELCQECANDWARGEGEHAAWLEAEEGNAP